MNKKILAVIATAGLILSATTPVFANGHFMPQNQQFSSGPNYRHILGAPTPIDTFNRDTSTSNIRRDVGSSNLAPKAHHRFSGTVPTDRVNPLIRINQPINPWQIQNPSVIPHFDTNAQGVNAPQNQNQATQGSGFLTPTSILGN